LAEDESSTIDHVRSALSSQGWLVKTVGDRDQALRAASEFAPQLVLINDRLAGAEDLIRTFSRRSGGPGVILLTTDDGGETEAAAASPDIDAILAKPLDKSELALRVRNSLTVKAYQDQLAYYDPLTNLPNKKLFLEHLDWAVKKAKRFKEHLALLTIALDNFNRINAMIGPSAGDQVLQQIGRRIEGVIRSVDVLGSSVDDEHIEMSLFRTEGNSFALLLDRIQGEDSAALVAERLIQIIKEPMHVDNTNIYVTASIGIATYPAESDDCTSLLRLASSAKDYVKNKGGNSFQFSSKDINMKYNKRLSLETRLRMALERDEFILHYQPEVNVRTGVIQGVEALLRWNSSDKGLVPPYDFIPLAEETGLIIPIGEWVLNEACSKLKKWHQAGRNSLSMAVNLSVKQFNDPGFFSTAKRIISRNGVDPQFLKFEITESLLLDNIDHKIEIMKQLSDIGLKLSIDDFGTGYSSLKYLSKLPVDELKIDRSFIIDVVENSSNRAIVLSVIFLSHCLGLKTVAEGVETKEQLNVLQKERCDQYQGFLFSRPVPDAELCKLLPPKG